ncbi:MAG: M23 family metallopeptidase, partial [Ardenticatenales bacterium]
MAILILVISSTSESVHTQSSPSWMYPWCGENQPPILGVFDHNYPSGRISTPPAFRQDLGYVTAYNGERRIDCRLQAPWSTQTPSPPGSVERTANYCSQVLRDAGDGGLCFRYDNHPAIDYLLNFQPVFAADDGMVSKIRFNNGLTLWVDHNDGVFQSIYGHLSSTIVHVGESVTKGQRIATSGGSGGNYD